MSATWSVVMVLLGLWSGTLNGSEGERVGLLRDTSRSLPAVEGPSTQQLQESLRQEFSLEQAA